MTPIETLLDRLPDAKKSANGWMARCPAHDDRRASLSIAQGDDGTALMKCHAGCETSAVLAAVGLKPADLFPQKAGVTPKSNGQPRNGQPAQTFPSANAALKSLTARKGRPSDKWTYHNAQGEPVGLVVRWDGPDGKDIRPIARHSDGWRIAAMPEPRPLYRLPELLTADPGVPVVVTEGEKACDAAVSCGLLATTSAGGAKAAEKTDWSPLAGRKVYILPDNDSAGETYAATVARLCVAAGAAEVRVVRLCEHAPGLPPGGDLADVLADERWCGLPLGDVAELADLAALLVRLAEAAEPWRSTKQPEPADDLAWRPFPVDALPEPIRGFVDAGARAIGCDPSYLALPLLTAIAAAIGNTRRLELKRGWCVPPILWGAIVGESGTAKTPAFRLAMRPVRERQSRAFKAFKLRQQEYEAALQAWENTKKSERGEKPQPPSCERFIVSDTTVEALAPILLENPRGLLLARDELSGWIGSFDRYANRGRASVDAANWLSMFNTESIIVDRKTGDPRTIHVPQAAVCVSGGIQPAILQRALGLEHRESGLAARLLLAYPPRKAKRWTESDIEPSMEAELVRLFDRLYELQPMTDDDGEPRPRLVRLSDDAKSAWREYYNEHNQEQVALDGDMASAWSKLEEYAARLALVVHFIRWAAGDVADETWLDAASMNAGIMLANWFKHEAWRVYTMLDESDAERDQRRLLEWISHKGGTVTAREVQMGCRWLREPSQAEAALKGLVQAGRGMWRDVPTTAKGGRPARVFVLSTLSTVNETPAKPEESEGFVDVDAVDTVDAPAPDPAEEDWGSV